MKLICSNAYKKPGLCTRELAIRPATRGADIALLQELEGPDFDFEIERVKTIMKLPYAAGAVEPDYYIPRREHGIAIASRYPIRRAQAMLLPQFKRRVKRKRHRMALAAEIKLPRRDLLVINLHLDMLINTRERIVQLTPVLEFAARWRGPCIIGGDFNSAPIWWGAKLAPLPLLENPSRDIETLMATHGFRTPFFSTGPTLKPYPVKIDWLYFRNIFPREYGLQKITHSDHHALWTDI